jgi:hypothetical protein
MSSSVPNIHTLTREIEERVKAARPSHLLYNPSNEWVEIMCNGQPLQIPPDGKGRTPDGVLKTFDGTVAVRDTYGVDPEALKKARAQGIKRPDIPANKIILTALEAISHAVRKRSRRGICFLTGNPEEDKPIKAAAKAVWIEYRKEQAERSINAYRLQTQAFHADSRNVGQPAPPMPDHVQESQEFLDDYRLGSFSRKQFSCPVNCGYYTDDESRLGVHVRASHPLANVPQPQALAPAIEETETDPEPAESDDPAGSNPRRPGRPRRVPYTVP